MSTIKEKLKKQLESGNTIHLNSSTLAALADEDNKKQKAEDITKESTVEVTSEFKKNSMVLNADTSNLQADLIQTNTIESVTITPEEKAIFLDAIINGGRYYQYVSLFGGKLTAKIVCRSQEESAAIIAQLNREIRSNKITTQLEYSNRLRLMLLAAQIHELNDVVLGPLREPLFAVVKSPDVIEEPGWLEQVNLWEKRPDALATALFNELKTFEKKYWTMVANADNQNFWNPAGHF